MLDDEQVERYARQIVVPGIGAAGQEKLLHSSVLVVGHPRGCRTASLYLRAAGVRLVIDSRSPSAVVLAGVSTVDRETLEWLKARRAPVCWYDADANGFTCGVHPAAGLPAATVEGPPAPTTQDGPGFHDAAACEAASAACAVILGLPCPAGPFRFDF